MHQAKADHSLPLRHGFKQSDAPDRPAALRPPHSVGARLPRRHQVDATGLERAGHQRLAPPGLALADAVFVWVADHLSQGRLEVQAATALAAPDAGRGVEGEQGVQHLGRRGRGEVRVHSDAVVPFPIGLAMWGAPFDPSRTAGRSASRQVAGG